MKTKTNILLYLAVTLLVQSGLLALHANAQAGDRFVSKTGLHQNNFLNWTDAATNIQDAVDAANADETIWVSNGHYICTSPVLVSAGTAAESKTMVYISKNIHLRSMNGPDWTTIDADGSDVNQVRGIFVYASGHTPTIDGFTITNGYIRQAENPTWPHYLGGGILVRDGNPVITNCVITGNYCSSQGAGVSLNFSGRIFNSVISNNTGSAAISLRDGGTVNWSRIVNNPSKGIHVSGEGYINNCLIISNGTYNGGHGNGVYLSNGGRIRNSLIARNQSQDGGGIYMYFSGPDAAPTVQNCTVAYNRSGRSGGGIYVNGAIATSTNAVVQNTIVYGNTASTEGPEFSVAGDGSAQISYCCSPVDLSAYGDYNIQNNPEFQDANDNDYTLVKTSPAINAGFNATWITDTTLDLGGDQRILYNIVDIGAYEAPPPAGMLINVH